MNSNNNQIDPIELVPNELFCQSLSFLRPSSIATSSAVSAKWRAVIQADSTLHQEIDLLKMSIDSDPDQIILHLNRLSSLALNQVMRLSLDVSSFFKTLHLQGQGVAFKQIFNLSASLQKSKHTLRDLSLVLRVEKDEDPFWNDGPPQPELVPFLLMLLRSLKFFSRLINVQVEAPVGAYMKAERDQDLPGSRRVSIDHGSGTEDDFQPDQPSLPQLIKEVNAVAGTGLTEFGLHYNTKAFKHSITDIVTELWGSRLTLTVLDVDIIGYAHQFTNNPDLPAASLLWGFAAECKRLDYLALNLQLSQGDPMQGFPLELKEKKTVGLKTLRLNLSKGFEIGWASFSRWIGTSLVDASVNFVGSKRSGVASYGIFSSIIKPSRETLKSIHLSGIGCGENEVSRFNPDDLNFPNLESLSLISLPSDLLNFFSAVKSERLHKLDLSASADAQLQDTITFLVKLLQVYQSNITSLSFNHNLDSIFKPPPSSEILSFTFPRLETISLPSFSDAFSSWFCKFQFPALIRLDTIAKEVAAHSYSLFKPNAPKLVMEAETFDDRWEKATSITDELEKGEWEIRTEFVRNKVLCRQLSLSLPHWSNIFSLVFSAWYSSLFFSSSTS